MPLLSRRRPPRKPLSQKTRRSQHRKKKVESLEERIVLSYSAAVLADSPLAYYSFEETAGTTADNQGTLGAAADGTIENGPALGVDSLPGLGQGISFNTNNTNSTIQNVALVDANTLGIQNGSFTTSAWIQRSESGGGDRFVFGSDTNAGSQGLHLGVRDNRTHFGFYGNDTNGPNPPDVVGGEWHHIAFSYNDATDEQAIYLDGEQLIVAPDHGPFTGNDIIRIGNGLNTTARNFQGIIDEAAIFDSVLTPAQIQSHFQAALDDVTGVTDDAITVTENDGPLTQATNNVVRNDTNVLVDGGTADGVLVETNTIAVLDVDTTGTQGTATVDAGGELTYDPNGMFDNLAVGETATDSFTYSVLQLQPGAPLSETVIFANTGPGGSINAYQLNSTAQTWDQARVAANNSTFAGVNGHLISVASAEENEVARRVAPGLDAWLGLTDSDQTSTIDGTTLQGTEAGTDPNGPWAWVDGTPFSYQNFAGGEPNDSGGEDAVQLRAADGLWNDHLAGDTLGQGNQNFVSIVEYELNAMSMAELVAQVAPGFVVTSYQHSGGVGTLAEADAFLASPTGVNTGFPVTALTGVVNFQQSGGAGHFTTGQTPVPGIQAGDQNNYVIEANSTVYIPTAGDYTFGVNSDDGFGLQIDGAELVSATGDQGSTLGPDGRLAFDAGRGTSDTLGVFNFSAPGFYDLNLVQWEGTGGSTVELFAAPGAQTGFNGSFQLVGSQAGLKTVTRAPTAADATDSATVTVTINGDYDPPAINDDTFTTDEASTVNGNVFSNDDPIDNGATIVGPPQQTVTTTDGISVTVNGDGSFSYTPDASQQALGEGDIATDSFIYVAASTAGGVNVPPFVLAPTGPGGTFNAYALVSDVATWDQARVDAELLSINGVSGHLATITSQAENDLLTGLTQSTGSSAWIGLTDSTGTSTLDGANFATSLGTSEAGTSPTNGWAWVTGEDFTFNAWSGGEPNNSGEEDVAELRADNGMWNDHNGGSTIVGGGAQSDPTRNYLVEFELNLDSPDVLFAGFNSTIANAPGGQPNNLTEAEAALAGGVVGTGISSTVNFNNSNNGDDIGFFDGDSGVTGLPNGRDNFVVENTAQVYIPAAGDYTFGVNSDDGFFVEITGASYVSGTNTADGGDTSLNAVGGENFAFNDVRGQGTPTLGVFNFSEPGYYPLRMLYWENGGGSNAELFAEAGAQTAINAGTQLVGDTANGGLLVVNNLDMATATITIEGVNDTPEVTIDNATVTVGEGSQATNTGTFTDIDASDMVEITSSVGSISQDAGNAGDFTFTFTPDDGPVESQTVTITATDSEGVTATTTFELVVDNVAPTATVTGPAETIPGEPVTFTVTADDPSDADDTAGFTFEIDFDGDGTIDDMTTVPTASADFTTQFDIIGTVTVRAFATDKEGDTSVVATTTIEVVPVAMIGDDIFAGGTDGAADRIIFSPSNGGVRVRYNNEFYPQGGGAFPINADTRLIANGRGSSDQIIVTSGLDLPAVFDGGAGNDYLAGGVGDDQLIGGAGNDIILGGEGDNVLIGDDREGDVIAGNDRLEGRSGEDTIFGGDGNDRLNGGSGDDILDGGADNDFVFGGLGNDLLIGREGADTINGSHGDDIILGGDSTDQLFGSNGNDLMFGGTGVDRLRGDAGDDLVSGNTSELDSRLEDALAAMLASMGTTLADADSDAATAVDNYFTSGTVASEFESLTEDGSNDDLTGGSGVDQFNSASDSIRDQRDGESVI